MKHYQTYICKHSFEVDLYIPMFILHDHLTGALQQKLLGAQSYIFSFHQLLHIVYVPVLCLFGFLWDGQFYCWEETGGLRKPPTCGKSLTNFIYHIMLYTTFPRSVLIIVIVCIFYQPAKRRWDIKCLFCSYFYLSSFCFYAFRLVCHATIQL